MGAKRHEVEKAVCDVLAQDLSAAVVAFHDALATRLSMNTVDFRCLAAIAGARGPMNPGGLATALGLSTAATTQILDRLEEAGLIARARDAHDRRRVVVTAVENPRLEQKLGRSMATLATSMAEVTSEFSVVELTTIRRFLAETSRVFDEVAVSLRDA
jgi:DNA-binding MarR family transcriptional regulator